MTIYEPLGRSWGYYKNSGEIEIERERGHGSYEVSMTESLVQAFEIFAGWCEPLAVALVIEPTGDSSTPEHDPSPLLTADSERLDGLAMEANLDSWSRSLPVERVSGPAVQEVTLSELQRLQTKYGCEFELYGVRFMAVKYLLGEIPSPSTFTLTEQGYGTVREVETIVEDQQQWMLQPQTESDAILLPVNLEILGTRRDDYDMTVSLNPQWSFFGGEDSPGWPRLLSSTEKLIERFPEWSITTKRPGSPHLT